jgi:hypothetical protein
VLKKKDNAKVEVDKKKKWDKNGLKFITINAKELKKHIQAAARSGTCMGSNAR